MTEIVKPTKLKIFAVFRKMSYLPSKPQNALVDRTVATWLLLQGSVASIGSAQGSLHTYSFVCEKSYLLPSCHLSIQIMLEDKCLQCRSCPCWSLQGRGFGGREGFGLRIRPSVTPECYSNCDSGPPLC